jgi:hypothetical protein
MPDHVAARPVQRQVSPKVFDDNMIAAMLANEAAVMASVGVIPEAAPSPSPRLAENISDVWAQAEARMESNGTSGSLHRLHRGNPQDLMFYASSHPHRQGLWVAEGCAWASHWKNLSVKLLVANAPYLRHLEELLGVVDVRRQLLLAGQEHILRQYGVL